MIQKVKLTFDEHNVLQSTVTILVKDFSLEPSILKAEIDDGVGVMILELKGEQKEINKALQYLRDKGIKVGVIDKKHIFRDHTKCFSCGSCTSICIVHALEMDPKTFEVHVHPEKCISCSKCLTACPVNALKINI